MFSSWLKGPHLIMWLHSIFMKGCDTDVSCSVVDYWCCTMELTSLCSRHIKATRGLVLTRIQITTDLCGGSVEVLGRQKDIDKVSTTVAGGHVRCRCSNEGSGRTWAPTSPYWALDEPSVTTNVIIFHWFTTTQHFSKNCPRFVVHWYEICLSRFRVVLFLYNKRVSSWYWSHTIPLWSH